MLAAEPRVRAILMECTELPPYSDAVRAATGLPVYDAITACNFFLEAQEHRCRPPARRGLRTGARTRAGSASTSQEAPGQLTGDRAQPPGARLVGTRGVMWFNKRPVRSNTATCLDVSPTTLSNRHGS